MATYVFICEECGGNKIIEQPISEPEPKIHCGLCDLPMQRKFGLQTIRFKGTGWGKDAK